MVSIIYLMVRVNSLQALIPKTVGVIPAISPCSTPKGGSLVLAALPAFNPSGQPYLKYEFHGPPDKPDKLRCVQEDLHDLSKLPKALHKCLNSRQIHAF